MNKKILFITISVIIGISLFFIYGYFKNDALLKEYLLLRQQKQTIPAMRCYVDCAQKDFSEYKKCINDRQCELVASQIK